MALSPSALNVNQHGGKTAVVLRDSERFAHVFEQPAESPFRPGNYGKDEAATRQHIIARLNDELKQLFDNLDSWAMEYIAEHPERLFGRSLSTDQIKFGLNSILKKDTWANQH